MDKLFIVLYWFIFTTNILSQEIIDNPLSIYQEAYNDSELAIYDLTILKASVDFNNDGIIDIAISDESLRGNAGAQWSLYLGLENGSYKYLDDIFFHPLAFKIQPFEKGVSKLIMYMREDAGNGHLVEYQISESGIKELNFSHLSPTNNLNDEKLYKKLFSYLGKNPIVFCCKLSKYKKNKNCKWESGYYIE